MRRAAGRQLLASLACLVFSVVYEYFGHGVYSLYMICLFLFPLLLGALPAFAFSSRGTVPSDGVRRVWIAGTATLAMGSCLTGVFEIYGASAPLTVVYWPAGAVPLLTAAIMYALEKRAKKTSGF